MTAPVVGIDLGGTKIFGVRVDPSRNGLGSVLRDHKIATPTGSAEAVIDAVVEVVRALDPRPTAVGIGTPGVVRAKCGTVELAPNLAGFDRPVELGSRLSGRLGCPVRVGNDVNLAALGEFRSGAARGASDVLALWLGTGVGGALILDGRLRTGPCGLAGEIGHVVVRPGGRRCGCGGLGHLEAYLGRRGLENEARARRSAGASTLLIHDVSKGAIKSKAFRKAYDAGDALTVDLLHEGFDLLAVAIANTVVTVDVSTVVLGGGLGERFADVLVPRLESGLADLHFAGAVPDLRIAELGDHAGALGAAHLVVDAP